MALDRQLDAWLFYSSEKGALYLGSYWKDVKDKYPDKAEATLEMMKRLPHTFWSADPIYVTSEMMTLLDHAWPQFQPEAFTEGDLLVPAGFVCLPRPVVTHDIRGIPMMHRYMAWEPIRRTDGQNGIMYATFADVDDITDEGRDEYDAKTITANRHYFAGAPMLGHITTHWYGEAYTPENFEDHIDLGNLTEPLDMEVAKVGWMEMSQFTGALFRLLNQRIAVAVRRPAPRAAARRGAKHNQEPKYITVITLRRPKQQAGDEHHPVEWTHRWITSGHWRWQPYGDGTVRQIWIAPYVKGPADKPLVVRGARVFTLAR